MPSVSETDLDHHPSVLFEKQVPKRIAVRVGERHALEVTVGPHVFRADLGQPAPHIPDANQRFSVSRHRQSIAERAATVQTPVAQLPTKCRSVAVGNVVDPEFGDTPLGPARPSERRVDPRSPWPSGTFSSNMARVAAASEDDELPVRRFGWSDMFVDPSEDPRADGGFDNNERAMLVGYLVDRRLTFEMKSAGLDAEDMSRRSVPPSDLSLLGLLRHLTDVERHWFRQEMAGDDAPDRYGEAEFEGAVPDPAVVEEAWGAWREEVAFAERLVAEADDLGVRGKRRCVPLREVLIHMIEEYARHNGHADLLRERIDGRVGQ